jgi:hypothetical protein
VELLHAFRELVSPLLIFDAVSSTRLWYLENPSQSWNFGMSWFSTP